MFESSYRHPALPLSLRVALFAFDRCCQPLSPGELREAVDPLVRSAEISRAIRDGKRLGLLAACSTSSLLHSQLRGDHVPGSNEAVAS